MLTPTSVLTPSTVHQQEVMKNAVLACVVLAVGVAAQSENTRYSAKPATRMLRADVLRDLPDRCFGSTTCAAYAVGQTWHLQQFCGQATCMKNATGHLIEKVEDCGPAPKPNENCTPLIPPPGTPFPDCCPEYECLPGFELEYPTEAEIKLAIEKAREADAEARKAAKELTGAAATATA